MADGLSRGEDAPLDIQRVAIVGVDAAGRSATGGTRIQTTITIDTSFSVGGVLVTPAIGEQWYVQRIENIWRLHSRLPFNDSKLLADAVEGQVAIGSTGPLDLFGSVVNIDSDLTVSGKLELNGVEIRGGQNGLEQKTDGDDEWGPIGSISTTDDLPEGETNKYFTPERAAEYVPVQSVNDHTGHVVIDAESIGLGNVNNTADADKPISEAVAAALAGKATAEQLNQIAVQLNNITNTQIPNIFSVFGAGASQTDWNNGWENLLAMLGLSSSGISESPGTFDPFAAVQNWVDNIIMPQGKVARLDDEGKLVGEQAPNIIDEMFAAWGIDTKDPLGLGKLWNGLMTMLGINQGDVQTDDVDTDSIWTGIINTLIKPQDLLATLVSGKLPDGQAPNLLLNLIVSVMDLFKAGWDSLFGSELYDGSFDDAWEAFTDALDWSSPPSTNVSELGGKVAGNILGGIWQPIGDYLSELPAWLDGLNTTFRGLSDAVWDYLLGGNRYDGTTRTAWSTQAGAAVEYAWKAFWLHITNGQPDAGEAPVPGSAQAMWNGVANNFLETSLNSWVRSITQPISDFFDTVRRYINQMIQGLHLGYLNSSWMPVVSFTTPESELPNGDTPVMVGGNNANDGDDISGHVDVSLPGAPKNVSAIPIWNPFQTGFPAGNITYAISAVKDGIEGPATLVRAFAGKDLLQSGPNAAGHVDLRWDAPPGGAPDQYRIRRQVDSYYSGGAIGWRLIDDTQTTAPGALAIVPVVDDHSRASGTASPPKTDAQLAAQLITDTQTAAAAAQTTVDNVIDGTTQVSPNTVPEIPGTKIITPVPPRALQTLPSGHVAATAPELLYAPNFGADYGVGNDYVVFSDGKCTINPSPGVPQQVYANAIACSTGQLILFNMGIRWAGLAASSEVAEFPIRFDLIAYKNGRPVQVFPVAYIRPGTATGQYAPSGQPVTDGIVRQVVQIGTGVDGLTMRVTRGPNVTAGQVILEKPTAQPLTRIAAEAMGSVDFQIVTSPVNNLDARGGSSMGAALQDTWDSMYSALGGPTEYLTDNNGDPITDGAGQPVKRSSTPTDVSTMLTIVNQTAVQALANSTANSLAIDNVAESITSIISAITILQTKVADLESSATPPPVTPPPPPPVIKQKQLYTITSSIRAVSGGWVPPTWAKTLHLMAVGGGGSSSSGGSNTNLPGSPGKFAASPVSIQAGVLDIVIGGGGISTDSYGPGVAGGATTVRKGSAGGAIAITAAGGAGGLAGELFDSGKDSVGRGPTPRSIAIVDGYAATGGSDVSRGQNGSVPGGAGAGVQNFFSNKHTNGARGQVWIVADSEIAY